MLKKFIFGCVIYLPLMAVANECNYGSNQGTEYVIQDQHKKYVLNNFMVNADRDKFGFGQRSERKYDSLKNQPFKVIKTDYVTAESKKYESRSESERFKDIKIDDKVYKLDRSKNIELLTKDCQKYYYIPSGLKKSFTSIFSKTDSKEIITDDYLQFLGNSLKNLDVSASSKYDKFEKSYEVKTDYANNMLIRGYYNAENGKTSSVQIYTDVLFFKDWGFIESAKDINGKTYTVTKIASNPKCEHLDLGLGCQLTETLGINLTEDDLRSNANGMEIKLYGAQTRVIIVPSEMINAFLSEIDKLKSS